MSYIKDYVNDLKVVKTNIKAAIETKKGSELAEPNNFGTYADEISNLPTGEDEPLEPWVRPIDWLDTPNPLKTEQKIVLLVHLDETWDFCTFYAQGAYTVDWGDGVVENFNSGVTAIHTYDLTTISDDTLTDDGMKQVIVIITPQDGNDITYVRTDSTHKGLKTKIVEAKCSVPKLSNNYMFYSQTYVQNIEFFSIIEAKTSLYKKFSACYNLKRVYGLKLLYPAQGSYLFYNCKALEYIEDFDIEITSCVGFIYNCQLLKYVDWNAIKISDECSSHYVFAYQCYNLKKVPEYIYQNTSNMQYFAYYCKSLEELNIGKVSDNILCDTLSEGCGSIKTINIKANNITATKLFSDHTNSNYDNTILTNIVETDYMFYLNKSSIIVDTSNSTKCNQMYYHAILNTNNVTFNLGKSINNSEMLRDTNVKKVTVTSINPEGSDFSKFVQESMVEEITVDLQYSTNNNYFAYNCYNLVKVNITNITKSIMFNNCPLDRTQLVGILNNLVDLTDQETQTCTLTGCVGVADLTDDDKAIATNKNWNLIL